MCNISSHDCEHDSPRIQQRCLQTAADSSRLFITLRLYVAHGDGEREREEEEEEEEERAERWTESVRGG